MPRAPHLLELKGADYMTGRSEVVRPLEDTLGQPPFEVFPVLSGQADAQVKVGALKTLVNVSLYSEALPPEQEKLLEDLQEPASYVVRLYVLRAGDLPERRGDKPDPFMRAKLGKQTLGSRKDAMKNTTEPAFFKTFTFKATLPGESVVRLEVVDHNSLNFDEVIGYTDIDLEDRVFCDAWKTKCSERPPVERRPLMVDEKANPQGYLKLFVEILSETDALERPPLDISPPPDQKWELRLICWEAKGVSEKLDDSGLSDLYVKTFLVDPKARDPKLRDSAVLRTDTHFRARNGKASRSGGPIDRSARRHRCCCCCCCHHTTATTTTTTSSSSSSRAAAAATAAAATAATSSTPSPLSPEQASWNWRFKIPLVLQHDSRMRRLTLQLFDRDITIDDLAGQFVMNLDPWLKRVYKRQVLNAVRPAVSSPIRCLSPATYRPATCHSPSARPVPTDQVFAPTYWDPTSGKRSSLIKRHTADQLKSIKEFVETLIVKVTPRCNRTDAFVDSVRSRCVLMGAGIRTLQPSRETICDQRIHEPSCP